MTLKVVYELKASIHEKKRNLYAPDITIESNSRRQLTQQTVDV